MPATAHPAPRRRLTFLDLPPETRIMIYKLTCSTFAVHVRPRFLTPTRQLLEQPTIVTLTNCNVLSLSKQIRTEALPYVQISRAIQICRSAIVEIHQAVARRPDNNGHSEATCQFLAQISPTPCDLHQSPSFSLLTSEHARTAKYFLLGFHGIQKEDCETISTIWMKVLERDHVMHGSIFRAPPPWWPENVVYGPVDLLGSDDRIHVLTHILLHAGSDTLADPRHRSHLLALLMHSAWRDLDKMQNPNTPEILEEMFKVRQLIDRMDLGDSAETILPGTQLLTHATWRTNWHTNLQR